MMGRTATVAGLLVLALGGCVALDSFLYQPVSAPWDTDYFQASGIPPTLRQELKTEVTSADGTQINTWLLTHAADATLDPTPAARHDAWVLYCHGNNVNLLAFARRLEAIWRLGYSVAALDYRGYGKTPGQPSEEGLYSDARAVLSYLRDHKATDAQLLLYGYSLGAAVCTQLASENNLPLLVLEAPFASIDALARDASGTGLPRSFFTRARYDNLGKIGRHKGDLLIFHGTHDTYLRPAYGKALADAAEGHARSVQWVPVPGADHLTTPCANRALQQIPPGDCAGGFDASYLTTLAAAADAALAAGPAR